MHERFRVILFRRLAGLTAPLITPARQRDLRLLRHARRAMTASLKSAKQGSGLSSGPVPVGCENEDAILWHAAVRELSADATRILTTMKAAASLTKEGVYRTEI
ncbi:hypothetical protein AB870_23380 (plasmid) [Pandoraea faecigallinarum]|uniref:Uncharacterized protein n=1 Tax=Pandoraea faecigallinarum TaxID=656179 RepID=A0A0H3WZM6_9BURK|nr:hypothetical protein AB870_23380 [Pandoraea faecigallinarum]